MNRTVLIVAIINILILAVGCSRSRYEPFCDELSGRDFKTCLIDSEFRDRYLSEQVEQSVKRSIRTLEKLPASLMAHTITNDIRRDSVRLESIVDLPVFPSNLSVTAHTNPELVGRYYVARAIVSGAYIGDRWERPSVTLAEIEPKKQWMSPETERLTKAQMEFLHYVCAPNADVCVGDFYIQILPSHLAGLLRPYVSGADIEPIKEPMLRDSRRKQLRQFLEYLDNLDAGT